MKNITHRVLILDKFSSPYIKQAIIILNDYDNLSDSKIVQEAEKVVFDYINRNYNLSYYRTSNKNTSPLVTIIFLSVLTLLITFGVFVIRRLFWYTTIRQCFFHIVINIFDILLIFLTIFRIFFIWKIIIYMRRL